MNSVYIAVVAQKRIPISKKLGMFVAYNAANL